MVGVEVGVKRGNNAGLLLKNLNLKKLYLVDPWVAYVDQISSKEIRDGKLSENFFKEVQEKFSKNDNVEIIRDFSVNAAKTFEDNLCDFVYIDGDHSYENVLNDLNAWYPKLKQYGVMCGDDYGHPSGVGVIKAVAEFVKNKSLIVHYGEDDQFWFVKV